MNFDSRQAADSPFDNCPPEAAVLRQSFPAGCWKDASPLGAGSIGALVYGGIAAETVLLNHEALWALGNSPRLPDVSAELPQVRALFDSGRYEEANRLYPEALRGQGYSARCSAFVPGPDLLIEEPVDSAFAGYVRRLDCSQALLSIEWQDGATPRGRDYFVSAAKQVLVIRCRAAAGRVRRVLRWRIHDLIDALDRNLNSVALAPRSSLHRYADGLGFEAVLAEGYAYSAAVRVCGADAFEFQDDGSLAFDAEGEVLLLVALAPLAEGAAGVKGTAGAENAANANATANAGNALSAYHLAGAQSADDLYRSLGLIDSGYAELFAEHMAEHSRIFGGLGIDLGADEATRSLTCEELLTRAYAGEIDTALVEKLFYFGRYLLHASSRKGTLPAHLQGLWNGDYAPPWRSAYFNNENLQMTYWQALPGNLAESLVPVFDLYEQMWDDFRRNAQAFFGCRGLLLPLYLSPDCGLQKDLQPHVVYWTGAGAWLAQLYWEYWLFTADREFLKSRALPFMREVARFYEDFIVIDAEGQARIYPGNSPENHPLLHGTESNIDICMNATMDVALVRELLTNLLAAHQILETDCAELALWRRLLKALPQYEINEDGAFKEWLHPEFGDNYNHRHLSHIYPFFPGYEITREPGEAWYESVVTAVNKRLRIGIGEQTGWSLVHLANIFARFGDAERATECFSLLAKACVGSNLFTYHNDYRGMGLTMPMRWGLTPPLQLDANFGFPAAVLEMLLYSSAESIRVLPALPEQWSRGHARGLLARGGICVDLEWDCARGELSLTLRSARATRVRLCWPEAFGQLAGVECDGAFSAVVSLEPDVPLMLSSANRSVLTNI